MKEKKAYGFYKNMSDEELIKYIEMNHRGEALGELRGGKDCQAYKTALKRGLIEELVEKGILIRAIKEKGFYKNMSDEQLIEYIEMNYGRKTLSELGRGKDTQAYQIACKRGLIDGLVEKGILIRAIREKGFYKNMSDEELIKYIEMNHRGEALGELRGGKDGQAYKTALKRGLIEELVEKGILIREQRPNGFYKNMSNEQLMEYIEMNHRGKALGELSRGKDTRAYHIALKRALIDGLVEKGILVRAIKEKGFYENMSDEQLIEYIEMNHGGKALGELGRGKDAKAYQIACKRGLIEELVEKGILIRTENRQGDSIGILETILEGDAT